MLDEISISIKYTIAFFWRLYSSGYRFLSINKSKQPHDVTALTQII